MINSAEADRDLTDIYVDGDACPVREEIYRVAARLRLNVLVVSNASRPIRPPERSSFSPLQLGVAAFDFRLHQFSEFHQNAQLVGPKFMRLLIHKTKGPNTVAG